MVIIGFLFGLAIGTLSMYLYHENNKINEYAKLLDEYEKLDAFNKGSVQLRLDAETLLANAREILDQVNEIAKENNDDHLSSL